MSFLHQPSDTKLLRRTFGAYPSGVAALAATVDGEPTVLVASSFTVGVSLEPPMCLFAVQNTSTTWPVLARAERLGVSVLGISHSAQVHQLAGKDKAARFRGIDVTELESGALLINGSPVHLECRVVHDYAAGDHRVIVLEVLATNTNPEQLPLVFHNSQFHTPVAV
ncbi:flavin reductase family protein [Streptomyces sp. NPDC050263]|uniref:flavin reductase family protein n=1 Tax=Streptomyces sp. NPDC050263 TaxID=3155037 RepID=UPI00342A1382